MKTTDDLHTFLNAAAGEGLELDGVDAANLYASVFPERYKAATQPTASLEQDNYDSIWNALHRIDSAAAMLPTYTVDHEGGIEAFTQNIVDAITRLAQPTASNAGEREALRQKIGRALAMVAKLCDGSQRWTMSVPARPDSDPDLVIADALRAALDALATKPPAGGQITHVIGIDLKTGEDKIVRLKVPLYTAPQPEPVAPPARELRCTCGNEWEWNKDQTMWELAHVATPPAQAVQDSAVLAYLDDLSDDAAAHIYPSDLEKCSNSECVVEVCSVRAGNGLERTVPLFSRGQVIEALNSARTRGNGVEPS